MITAAIVKPKPDLQELVDELFNTLKAIKGWHRCEACKDVGEEVRWYAAMTAYHWDKEKQKEDPNRDVLLCPHCWTEYERFWTSQWDEYNASRG